MDPANQFHSAYAGMANNPVSCVDPSGAVVLIVPVIKIGIGIGMGIAAAYGNGTSLWEGAVDGYQGAVINLNSTANAIPVAANSAAVSMLIAMTIGAATGAFGTVVSGENIGRGALIGAISSGVISGLFLLDAYIDRLMITRYYNLHTIDRTLSGTKATGNIATYQANAKAYESNNTLRQANDAKLRGIKLALFGTTANIKLQLFTMAPPMQQYGLTANLMYYVDPADMNLVPAATTWGGNLFGAEVQRTVPERRQAYR